MVLDTENAYCNTLVIFLCPDRLEKYPVSSQHPETSNSTTSLWFRLKNNRFWHIFTEATILASLLLIVAAIFVFIQIADEVREKEQVAFDEMLLQWFRKPDNPGQTIGPRWLEGAALDVTALGGVTVLIFVVLVTLGFLWIAQKRRAFFLVAAASIGGQIFNSSLKGFFSRPRPTIVPHLTEVSSSSFPSGHSMMSAVVYLTLGALLSRLVSGRLLRSYIVGVSIFLTLAVGTTRVFLGVHYPTDVLGGWTAGLSWALICLLVARILQAHGQVERPGQRTEHPLSQAPSNGEDALE